LTSAALMPGAGMIDAAPDGYAALKAIGSRSSP
jgi:hypothetical protein